MLPVVVLARRRGHRVRAARATATSRRLHATDADEGLVDRERGRCELVEHDAGDELEDERDFLMQSLDDLELERESGGIDDESYHELHDDYTARAAAMIRALRDGVDAPAGARAAGRRAAPRSR